LSSSPTEPRATVIANVTIPGRVPRPSGLRTVPWPSLRLG
jgi:hypothetical protein